jgi:hypothetical protein
MRDAIDTGHVHHQWQWCCHWSRTGQPGGGNKGRGRGGGKGVTTPTCLCILEQAHETVCSLSQRPHELIVLRKFKHCGHSLLVREEVCVGASRESTRHGLLASSTLAEGKVVSEQGWGLKRVIILLSGCDVKDVRAKATINDHTVPCPVLLGLLWVLWRVTQTKGHLDSPQLAPS